MLLYYFCYYFIISVIFGFDGGLSLLFIGWEVAWIRPCLAVNNVLNPFITFCNWMFSDSDKDVSSYLIIFSSCKTCPGSSKFSKVVNLSRISTFVPVYFKKFNPNVQVQTRVSHNNKCPRQYYWPNLHFKVQSTIHLALLVPRYESI